VNHDAFLISWGGINCDTVSEGSFMPGVSVSRLSFRLCILRDA